MNTRITELFGIEYPIVQGGMAWVSDAHLAAAVSEAGGLGVIAAGNAPASWVKEQIDILRIKTNKPFGVNIMLLSPFKDEVAHLLAEEKVPVIFTGAGNPEEYISIWKDSGAKIVPVVASSALAIMMQAMEVDAVVAEGSEAGGHIGELTTMVLTPNIVNSVDIPVISAGGIWDSKSAIAAFVLGADGIQVGTRFVLAEECTAHDEYKNKIIKAKDVDTKVTGRVTGHPVRSIRNPLVRKMLKAEYSENGAEIIEELGAGSLRKAVVEGNVKEGTFMAGQVGCMLTNVETAKEIIDDIFDNEKINEIVKNIS